MKTKLLYRPVGATELLLIIESGYQAFPPRLEWQPIFYPVLNKAYADQIALDWNTKDAFSGYCGFITCFELEAAYLEQFPIENVGGKNHDELWVPAEKLDEFNQHILNNIQVIDAFFGADFKRTEHKALNDLYQKFGKNEIG